MSSAARQRKVFVGLAAMIVPAIAVLSFLPSSKKQILHTRGRYHSWGHLLAFAVISFIAARAVRSLRWRIAMFVASLFFGAGIEFFEHVIYSNSLEWKDVLVDAFGVVIGTLLAIATAPVERPEDEPEEELESAA